MIEVLHRYVKYNLPKSPPNIKTHNVQPEETGQEREMDDER